MLTNKNPYHKLISENGIEYYTVEGMEQIHNEMLRLLKIVNEICNKNGLSYWLDGGSAIGVVRHQGFIPWDDDLDISLLKNDYLRLIDLLQDYCEANDDVFLFFAPKQKWHCANYFASSKVYFRCYGSAELIPVKIDIRPVNGFKNTKSEKDLNLKKRDTANYILFNKSLGYINNNDIDNMSFKQRQDFFYEYNNCYGLDFSEGTVLSHPYFEFSNEIPFSISDFLPIVFKDFEDIKVPIPHKYDKLLTILYGDYMTLPNLENRAPVACEVFERNISIADNRKLLSLMFFEKTSTKNRCKALYLSAKRIGIINFIKIKLSEK